MLKWQEGEAIPRQVYALVRQGKESFEAVVDLAAGKVASWEKLEGVQPNWLGSEFGAVVKEALAHPDFVAALKKRGIEDTVFLHCDTIPPGYFGTEEQRGRRVGHVRCKDVRGVRNTWSREIEGLTAVVDLDAKTVLRVVDEGATPVAMTDPDYHAMSEDLTADATPDQAPEQRFDVQGHHVAWERWRFHVRPDLRAGMVVSLVRHVGPGGERSVLYEGHLSEIFVPYMDPSFAWYARNFLDAGEFSAGGLSEPLLRGRDCPAHAFYFDSVRPTPNGRPRTTPRTLCLFERATGDPLWRHYASEAPQSRTASELVVRSSMVVGNYDYLLDWIFRQDGSIRVAVGATGILEVKAVDAARADAKATADALDDAYGRFVDERLVAVNHDHYFSFRLEPGRGRPGEQPLDGPTDDANARRRTPAPQHLGAGRAAGGERGRREAEHRFAAPNVVARAGLGQERGRLCHKLPPDARPHRPHAAFRGRLPTSPRRLHRPPSVGHPAARRRALGGWRPPHLERNRAWACPPGPQRTAKSATRTSSSGTRSAYTTCRAPKTGR